MRVSVDKFRDTCVMCVRECVRACKLVLMRCDAHFHSRVQRNRRLHTWRYLLPNRDKRAVVTSPKRHRPVIFRSQKARMCVRTCTISGQEVRKFSAGGGAFDISTTGPGGKPSSPVPAAGMSKAFWLADRLYDRQWQIKAVPQLQKVYTTHNTICRAAFSLSMNNVGAIFQIC